MKMEAPDDKIIHFKGVKELQQYQIEQEREEIRRSWVAIMENIEEIRQDLKKCTSLGEKSALNERALYIDECLQRIIKEVDPRKAVTPIERCNDEAITALKYVNDETYKEIETQLNQLIADISSFDISKGEQINESSDTEKKSQDITCHKDLNPIIDDLIEIKIKELANIKLDKDFPDNGFDRTHQVIQSIEKDIVDFNFDEEQRVLYLGRLMNEIISKDLLLYHQGIHEYIPVDITSEILEWADKYLIAN